MNLNQQRAASILKAYEQPNKSIREVIEENFAKGVIDQALYESALNQLETIEKGFFGGKEGSRGGKVIGHTRSGKPIYDSFSHKEHKHFTKEDHDDASHAHGEIANHHYDSHKKIHGKGPHGSVKDDHAEKYFHHNSQKTQHSKHWADMYSKEHNKGLKKSITDEDFLLDFVLEKAGKGEGSRGGHVIGHTSSGKPVYDSFNHASHKNFSSDEHRAAAAIHGSHASINEMVRNSKKQQHHNINADLHREEANIKDSAKNKEHLANKLQGKNGYVGFTHTGQRVEVYANSQYDAIKQIREKHKVPKSKEHMVHAHLAEKDGKQVTHSTSSYFD